MSNRATQCLNAVDIPADQQGELSYARLVLLTLAVAEANGLNISSGLEPTRDVIAQLESIAPGSYAVQRMKEMFNSTSERLVR